MPDLKVNHLMSKKTATLLTETLLQDAVDILKEEFIVPVLSKTGEVVGICTKDNLLDALLEGKSMSLPVGEIMEKSMTTISPDADPEEVWNLPDKWLLVVDQHKNLLGMINKDCLLRYFFNKYRSTLQKLNAVLDSAHNCILAVDQKGMITIFNKAAEKLLSIKATDTLGKRVDMVLPSTGLLSTLKKGRPELGQKLTVKDKTIFSNRTPIFHDGEVVGAVAVFQDITEIQQLTEQLSDSRNLVETLETILESSYEGIVVVDNHGVITKFNKAYQEFLGIKEDDAVGKHVTNVIENTRMHIVVQTGQAEIGDAQKIQGKEMIVQRIPIYKNAQVVGAVGKVLFRDLTELRSLMQRLNMVNSELDYYKKEVSRLKGAKYNFNNIIGQSNALKKTKELAKRAAVSNSTVLLTGESGVGKELFAHAIHESSLRKYGAFIRFNCAAIPANLMETELFGYEKGAFTGAQKDGKPGKFELANGGTILLDEIGEMPLEMQAKILRVLQEKEVERVGGSRLIPLNVRVIASTNRNLDDMVASGEFRRDLYYRLNVIKIEIPPLRETREDIPLLIEHFLNELNDELGTRIEGVTEEVLEILKEYQWIGNIRELKNVLERAVNVCQSDYIEIKDLPLFLQDSSIPIYQKMQQFVKEGHIGRADLKTLMEQFEKKVILETLRITGGNKKQTADLLNIHRSGLYQKINKYQLEG